MASETGQQDEKCAQFKRWACTPCGKFTIFVVILCGCGFGAWVVYHFAFSGDESFDGPYKREAIATDTQQCSEIGKDILNVNGSAVDAAIAAMFCLGVVSMHSSGIGGGGVMLLYNQTLKKATVIDFRETAPATAYWDVFRGREEEAKKGGRSIAVPGEVRGQFEAWKRHGRLPWKRLVQPAIDLAKNGFKASKALGDALKTTKGIEEDIRNDPGLSELLLVDNKRLVKKGDVIKNEKYAMTLERVRDDPESFYNGALASDIIRDLKKVNGMVTDSDLRDYRPITRNPYQRGLSGMKMYLTPPPTSGAVLGLILNILQGYNMTSSAFKDKKSSVLTYHRIIEAFKFSYAWRSLLGDPKFNSNIEEKKAIAVPGHWSSRGLDTPEVKNASVPVSAFTGNIEEHHRCWSQKQAIAYVTKYGMTRPTKM